MAYTPAITSVVTSVAAANNQPFIPSGSNPYGDNPDSGTMAQRVTACTKVSPLETTVIGVNFS
jgi:hypothetical protein